MKQIKVYKIWNKVNTIMWNYNWIILEVNLSWHWVKYYVSYFDDWLENARFYDYELQFTETKKQTIWFNIHYTN